MTLSREEKREQSGVFLLISNENGLIRIFGEKRNEWMENVKLI
jgi:hypothetical protein